MIKRHFLKHVWRPMMSFYYGMTWVQRDEFNISFEQYPYWLPLGTFFTLYTSNDWWRPLGKAAHSIKTCIELCRCCLDLDGCHLAFCRFRPTSPLWGICPYLMQVMVVFGCCAVRGNLLSTWQLEDGVCGVGTCNFDYGQSIKNMSM